MATGKKVVRRSAAAPVRPEETSPGDQIELSVTEEVRTNTGSRWVKVGLTSAHRESETSAEATERIQGFVFTSLDELIAEAVNR